MAIIKYYVKEFDLWYWLDTDDIDNDDNLIDMALYQLWTYQYPFDYVAWASETQKNKEAKHDHSQ